MHEKHQGNWKEEIRAFTNEVTHTDLPSISLFLDLNLPKHFQAAPMRDKPLVFSHLTRTFDDSMFAQESFKQIYERVNQTWLCWSSGKKIEIPQKKKKMYF